MYLKGGASPFLINIMELKIRDKERYYYNSSYFIFKVFYVSYLDLNLKSNNIQCVL